MHRTLVTAVLFLVQWVAIPAALAQTPTAYGAVCAQEGQRCTFQGTAVVYFGANDRWVAKAFTNGADCNNSVFGDPNAGVVKQCRFLTVPPMSARCASDNGYCPFSGSGLVFFGSDVRWSLVERENGAGCNASTFPDASPGMMRQCYVLPTGYPILPPSYTVSVTAPQTGQIGSDDHKFACGQVCADCGLNTACKASYPVGTKVTFRAKANAGFLPGNWTGPCTGSNASECSFTVSSNATLGATFVKTSTFTVTANPTTGGRITSSTFNCSSGCSAPFEAGGTLQVYAEPAAGYAFNQWGGACAGQGSTCALKVTQDSVVSATFNPIGTVQVTLTAPAEAGQLSGNPGAFACGKACATCARLTSCSAAITKGQTVNLTAMLIPGYSLVRWTGPCTGTGLTCSFTATADTAVGAVFSP